MESKTIMATIKLMNQDLVHLDRFDGTIFTRSQNKLKFLLKELTIFYIPDLVLAPLSEPTNRDIDVIRVEGKSVEMMN